MQQGNLQTYDIIDCLKMVVGSSSTKFIESVDVAVRLNVDVRKPEEQVRGVVVLPKSTEKNIKVAVFTDNEYLLKELKCIADVIGGKDLVNSILVNSMKENRKLLDVDWCITTYDFVEYIKPVAKILGHKGLMPDPKFNTVTPEVVRMVNIIKSGQIKFKTDKYGIIHAKIGNIQFSVKDLFANFMALVKAINDVKPNGIKGDYFKSIFINSTMGKSLRVGKVGKIFSKEYYSEA
ncbi:50S ribosomal protein L1 [Candidatus Mesenet endosymbiont of Agriotes lineatus]|uniref:50S ribosomal protein L1 n=1 Tax=Candidatus Mesenet endosymbiont of Agriotes lineatus TaxID=3077948 RepID=UPI0030D0A046